MFWFLATVVKQGALLNQTFYYVMSKFCCANAGIRAKLRSRVWTSEKVHMKVEELGGASWYLIDIFIFNLKLYIDIDHLQHPRFSLEQIELLVA